MLHTNNPVSDSKSPHRILLAEDAADLREAVVEVLRDMDYIVYAARDGYEAVTMFAELKPDLAILDMRMPMMNGTDVCSAIRQTSDIPIIMFTSADDVADVNGAILKGATDFVLKTTGIDELVTRIEGHLNNQLPSIQPRVPKSIVPQAELVPLLPNVHISTGSRSAIKSFTVIVDPDKNSRLPITTILTRLNQDFIEVDTAAEGILAVERHDPDFIITEWALSDMDAFKMLSELKRGTNAKKLIRVVMAKRLKPEAHRKSNYVGVKKFLDKPLDNGKVEILVGDCIKKALRNLKRRASISA